MKRIIAWGVLTLWMGFWTYFVVAGGILDGGGWPALLRVLVFLAVFGTGALVSWLWPRWGQATLLFTSIGLTLALLLFFKNTPGNTLFLLLTMALPPLVAAQLMTREP